MNARRAFTLVEILIVVLILAIIAAVAIPRFSNAGAVARASMLADDLRIIRMQINVFKGQHNGISPGYPDCNPKDLPTEDAFILHMTRASNVIGETAAPGTAGFNFGPYLREIPENPVNGKKSIHIILDHEQVPAQADNSHGWTYHPYSLTIKADSTGTDEGGRAYIDY